MKIVVTGSLGNIGKPLTQKLISRGHDVTLISSNPERKKDIEALGASPAIGKIEDGDFLINTFAGADAVYCMSPLSFTESDPSTYFNKISNNYVKAIKKTGIKRVVSLSGWAATFINNGNLENIIDSLSNLSITELRPTIFYTNFFSFIDMIKSEGVIVANYGGEDKIALVSPNDIADVIVEELEMSHDGVKVRYVASDEMTCNEAARILGAAIGKPDLKWITISAEQMIEGLKMMNMPEQIASMLAKMQSEIHSGKVQEEYYHHRPKLGKVKMTDFIKEFVVEYNKK